MDREGVQKAYATSSSPANVEMVRVVQTACCSAPLIPTMPHVFTADVVAALATVRAARLRAERRAGWGR